jgi:hypothetical protein
MSSLGGESFTTVYDVQENFGSKENEANEQFRDFHKEDLCRHTVLSGQRNKTDYCGMGLCAGKNK